VKRLATAKTSNGPLKSSTSTPSKSRMAMLRVIIARPHPLVRTKLWALLWCAQHEAVHAGQIGLLRRQLGHAPLR
jgi:hypothetical protein